MIHFAFSIVVIQVRVHVVGLMSQSYLIVLLYKEYDVWGDSRLHAASVNTVV